MMESALRTMLIDDVARALILAAAAALIVLFTGRWWMDWLRKWNIRKRARNEGSDEMMSFGQITMGGIMIVVPVIILTVLFNMLDRWSMLLPIVVMVAYAALGALDDYYSLDTVRSASYGLTVRAKGVAQWVVAILASIVLYMPEPLGLAHAGYTWIPFVGRIDMGVYFIPIAAIIIWVTVNAVNITDGVDGLSAWTLMVAFMAYGLVAMISGGFTNLMVLCFTLVGACAGYLWHNAHPAPVIMGDLGSMALGGVLAIIALQSQQWLLLPLIGGIFVVEGLSSMLQVLYFKYTRWRTGTPVRWLKMAPLHHHLRINGWSNPQITQRFVIIAMACAFVAISLLMWT